MLTLPQVPPEEAAPFYGPFLAACPDGRVGVHLRAQASELEALCAGLSESGAMFQYAEGKWTVKEVIGHLLDTERVYAYRLLRISRGDVRAMPGFDERSYVPAGQFNLRSVNELVSEFKCSERVRWHSRMASLQPRGCTSGLRMASARALARLSTSFSAIPNIIFVF